MMAENELLKHVFAILTILVLGCAAEEALGLDNVNKHLEKRSAERFWKRDTDKSLVSFWKRAADAALEQLNSDDEAEEKRRVQFLGKRDEVDSGEYLDDEGLDDEKRSRLAFLGKRGRQPFLGKRNRVAFLGKRERQQFLGKRGRQPFLGKRDDDDDSDLTASEIEAYLDELNDQDLDKRNRLAFLGKRGGRHAFLGKRVGLDGEAYEGPLSYKRYSYLGKRPRVAFLGKRAFDAEDDKRSRVAFLGKRSAEQDAGDVAE